jgi:hypothetical protein
MEISELCCKNSIWIGDNTKFIMGRADCEGKEFTEGAIVQSINGNYKDRLGIVVYLSGMGDCCIDDLRKSPSHINGYHWREFGENLKLISERPMTKNQYGKLKDKKFFNVEIDKSFLDLKLKQIYIFGNPEKEENIEGNLFYELRNRRNFVSWFSGKEWDSYKISGGFNSGGIVNYKKRFVSPLNPTTNKSLKKFHNSKYLDSFIKECLLEAILKKEAELTELPF